MSDEHRAAIQYALYKIVTAKKAESSASYAEQKFFPRSAFDVVAAFTGGTQKDSPTHYEVVKADGHHFASALLTADCALRCTRCVCTQCE